MKRIHYSWVVCAVCTLLLFCTVGLASSAFSVHQPYIIAENGFTNAEASTIVTVRYIAGMSTMLFVDKIVGALGAKRCAVAALLLEAAGFATYGLAKTAPVYYVGAAFAGVGYTLGGMVLVSILIANWFCSSKALAISICSAGTGIASILCPLIVTSIVESSSLAVAFFVESAFVVLCAGIASLFLMNTPREKRMMAYTSGREEKAETKSYGVDVSRKIFALLCAAVFLLGGVMNVDTAYISTLYRGIGHDGVTVSFILSTCGITMIVGKLIYGAFVDRVGGYRSNYIFITLFLLGQILHCMANTGLVSVAVIAQIMLGGGLPIATVGITVIATDFSTEKSFAKNLKILQFSLTAGSLVISPLPGIMADHTDGSYLPVFQMCVIMAIIYGVMLQFAYRYNRSYSARLKLSNS